MSLESIYQIKQEKRRKALEGLTTREEIDEALTSLGLTTSRSKSRALRQEMGVRSIHIEGDETDDDAYYDDVSFFLEGTWRSMGSLSIPQLQSQTPDYPFPFEEA